MANDNVTEVPETAEGFVVAKIASDEDSNGRDQVNVQRTSNVPPGNEIDTNFKKLYPDAEKFIVHIYLEMNVLAAAHHRAGVTRLVFNNHIRKFANGFSAWPSFSIFDLGQVEGLLSVSC